MSCGHKVGRESIFEIIRTAITDKKTKITCPLVLNCNKEWKMEELEKIMIFTKKEKAEVVNGLKKNKILEQQRIQLAQQKQKQLA